MPPTIRTAGRISVVIPTLNEAERLPQLVVALDREPELREIIVADGGSNDGTLVTAKQLGAAGKVDNSDRLALTHQRRAHLKR